MRASKRSPARLTGRGSVLIGAAMVVFVSYAPDLATAQTVDDPFLWLEEVEGERALEWVETRSQETLAELSGHPLFDPVRERILEILNSDDRIPFPSMLGDWVYNFWQDAEHPRGIWRRAAVDRYLAGEPDWQTVLDIDALAEAEDVNWSFGGATCLRPDYERCLVRLSRGGADAVEVREFDVEARAFIEDGFFLPEAKLSIAWIDEDRLLVATDFGEGSLTTSGYARIAKLWERGTPLDEARTLFEGETDDVSVNVVTYHTGEKSWPAVIHRPEFFDTIVRVLLDDELVLLDLPLDATPILMADQMVVRVRSDWDVGGQTHRAGSLVAIGIEDFLDGERGFQTVYEPDARSSVRGVTSTRGHLLVNLLRDVQSELRRYSLADGAWTYETVPAPELETANLGATSPDTDRYFFTSSGYTRPTTLFVVEEDGSINEVQRTPEMFEATGLVVQQYEAVSADGTRIPYFVVHREDMQTDGMNPTLLYAYGGF
jgi:prolyl oligopeptidase